MSSPTTPRSSSTQVTLGDPRPSILRTNRRLTTPLHTGNARPQVESHTETGDLAWLDHCAERARFD
jgi:hypothetical protein